MIMLLEDYSKFELKSTKTLVNTYINNLIFFIKNTMYCKSSIYFIINITLQFYTDNM